MFFAKPLVEVSVEDIRQLELEEFENLDYKFKIEDANDLAREVVAMANTSGGLLVVGFESDKGAIVSKDGFPTNGESLDHFEQKWVNFLETKVEPKIVPPPQVCLVDAGNGNALGLIWVRGRSSFAPHRVLNYLHKEHRKKKATVKPSKVNHEFFIRRGSESRAMSHAQIKASFESSRRGLQRIADLHDRRVSDHCTQHGVTNKIVPGIMMHLVPPRSLAEETAYTDVEELLNRPGEGANAIPVTLNRVSNAWNVVYNFDGVALWSIADDDDGSQRQHVQLFHDGSLEFLNPIAGRLGPDQKRVLDLNLWWQAMNSLRRHHAIIKMASGQEAFYVFCSLVVMRSAVQATHGRTPFNKDTYTFPAVLVRSLSSLKDDLTSLKTMVEHTLGLSAGTLKWN